MMFPMPTTPPTPWLWKPGIWITRWRSDVTDPTTGRRRQYAQRFRADTERDALRQYRRWLAIWSADEAMQEPAMIRNLTVADVAVAYQQHAARTYTKHGRMTTHVHKVRSALQKLVSLHGGAAADELTPPRLARLRDSLDGTATRQTINAWLTVIRHAWRWAAEQGLCSADVALRLGTVANLQAGRCRSGEDAIIPAVHWSVVEATLPHLHDVLRAMVQVQYHAGMRPGEVCCMRWADVDTSGDVWLYRPTEHKSEHVGRPRVIGLGPQAQAILQPFLCPDLMQCVFRPDAVQAHGTRRRMSRRYTEAAYRRAIHRACERAFPAPAGATDEQVQAWRQEHQWSPHQIRHAKEADIERAEGISAASLYLGHGSASTTAGYGRVEREQRELHALRELARKYG